MPFGAPEGLGRHPPDSNDQNKLDHHMPITVTVWEDL